MFTLIRKFKREFVYCSYLFLILELLITKTFIVNIYYFLATAVIGYLLINAWLISTYKLHGAKKVSKYSDALLKVKLWDRLFSYVLLPLLFYSAVVVFLLFSSSLYLNQIVIVVSLFLFFYLFLYVRTSYEKIYSVNKVTRVVYDFISIVVFFLLSEVILRIGLSPIISALLLLAISLMSFLYILYHHNKIEAKTAITAVFSSMIIAIICIWTFGLNSISLSAVLSILFYLTIALWNVRFGGSRKISDYIPPLMFSLMALILILNI
ncbi:hypothetical protein M0R04_01795 [Candidatus Dojkabacteria bacterium]|jgi:hypothetical protein|nr:hypothetical protein [Candidatus Dojkabacteria bacterium]